MNERTSVGTICYYFGTIQLDQYSRHGVYSTTTIIPTCQCWFLPLFPCFCEQPRPPSSWWCHVVPTVYGTYPSLNVLKWTYSVLVRYFKAKGSLEPTESHRCDGTKIWKKTKKAQPPRAPRPSLWHKRRWKVVSLSVSVLSSPPSLLGLDQTCRSIHPALYLPIPSITTTTMPSNTVPLPTTAATAPAVHHTVLRVKRPRNVDPVDSLRFHSRKRARPASQPNQTSVAALTAALSDTTTQETPVLSWKRIETYKNNDNKKKAKTIKRSWASTNSSSPAGAEGVVVDAVLEPQDSHDRNKDSTIAPTKRPKLSLRLVLVVCK